MMQGFIPQYLKKSATSQNSPGPVRFGDQPSNKDWQQNLPAKRPAVWARKPHPQLQASTGLAKVAPTTDLARERKLKERYDEFLPADARISDQIDRKQWLREVMPDAQVLRMFTIAWSTPGSQVYGHGFVCFFRTDRDTLGLVFEDLKGFRSIWVLDLLTKTPRRLGNVA